MADDHFPVDPKLDAELYLKLDLELDPKLDAELYLKLDLELDSKLDLSVFSVSFVQNTSL
jgi:hypothetical protein